MTDTHDGLREGEPCPDGWEQPITRTLQDRIIALCHERANLTARAEKAEAEIVALKARVEEAERERDEARLLVASGAYDAAFDAGSSMWTYTVALCVEKMRAVEATYAKLLRDGSAAALRAEEAERDAARWRDLEDGLEVYVRGIRVHVPKGEPGDF